MKINVEMGPVAKGYLRDAAWTTAGLVVGVLATNYIISRKYEKLVEEEIESVKEVYSKRLEDAKKEAAEALEDVVEAAEEVAEVVDPPLQRFRKQQAEALKTAEDIVESERYQVVDTDGPASMRIPEIIGFDDFADEDWSHYEKVTLKYYPDQDLMVDESDNVVVDVVGMIGDSALKNFGYANHNPDIVLVRNHYHEVDYEVVRETKS